MGSKSIMTTAPVLTLCMFGNVLNAQLPAHYWQQEVNYVINVSLDDSAHELTGDVTITYINHSPHDLDSLYFHLWPNAYGSLNTALAKQQRLHGKLDFHFSKPEERGFIDRLDFHVDATATRLKQTADPDIAVLYLNETLRSGSRIAVTTPFRVKIPKAFSRMGRDGHQYQITQWYPKPAVFDRDGWHPMPYLDQGEFYADVGSFEVNITLPSNYVVAATGNLKNADELRWLKERARETQSRMKSVIKSPDFDREAFPPSSARTKTLRYTEKNIIDFAWFADKRYHVMLDSVSLPSGHQVMTWGFFTDAESHLWKNAAAYVKTAVGHYSNWVGEYPYDNCTAVQGALLAGAGMEYPTITVIGQIGSAVALENVIAHEVGHNWFQGMLATNEHIYAWMDEGINSYYEQRYMETVGHFQKRTAPRGNFLDIGQFSTALLFDMAAMQMDRLRGAPAIESYPGHFTQIEYGVLVYGKAASAMRYLAAYLGQAQFDFMMQDFFDTWKFKHPTPKDMRQFFEMKSGSDLGWFFDGVIASRGQVDYGIAHIQLQDADDTYRVTLKNHGDIASPVQLGWIVADQEVGTFWLAGFHRDTSVTITAPLGATHLQLDPQAVMLDINPHNNVSRLKGILKKTEPPQLAWLLGLPNPRTSQIFFSPVVAWNNYDGIMAGVALYNSIFPVKNTEVVAVPMFGLKSVAPVGVAGIRRYIYPRSGKMNWSLGVSGKSFHYDDFQFTQRFTKVQPELRINVKPKVPATQKFRNLSMRSVLLREESESVRIEPGDTSFVKVSADRYVNELAYRFGDRRKLNPVSTAIVLQQNHQMVKLAAEVQQGFTTRDLPRNIRLRLFGGAFIVNNLSLPEGARYPINLSGPSGINDYMYDHTFFGRSEFEGFLYQQIVSAEGGFKVRTDKYGYLRSDEWLVALNLSVPVPLPAPIDLFFDVATLSGAGRSGGALETLLWETGVALVPVPGILEIYFPVFLSSDLKTAFADSGTKYLGRITFTMQLEKLNPFVLVREMRGPG